MNQGGSTTNQYFAATVINIATFGYGCCIGWASPVIPILKSSDLTPLNHPLTDNDVSWMVGLVCLGGMAGTPLFTYLVGALGRKMSGYLILIPSLIQWVLLIFATETHHIFIARFFGGLSGSGILVLAPLMVAEFAEDHVRGILGSFLILMLNIGLLFAYVVGAFASYYVVLYIMVLFPVIHTVMLIFLPETPQFLLKQGKTKEAMASLKWYRGIRDTDLGVVHLEKELHKIQMTNSQNNLDNTNKVTVKDFWMINLSLIIITFITFILVTRESIRGMVIGIVLMATQQASGLFAIVSYAGTIFQEAGSSLSPNLSAIIIGFIQVLGTFASTLLVERAGRKFLLITSCLGTGICLFVLATYTYYKAIDVDVTAYGWIPVSSLSICVVMYPFGLGTLPYVMISEIFSPKIRDLASPICTFSVWTFAFICLKYYNDLCNALGTYGAEYLFSSCMVFGVIFVWLMVPETKGRPIEDILEDLSGRKKKFTDSSVDPQRLNDVPLQKIQNDSSE